ncbi:hypothetical protein MYX82_07170 [Acidobacteria bacterium AH-259-D05]|nr:hypothetical protein [Acidobacteria bacterium AH-259-D05]
MPEETLPPKVGKCPPALRHSLARGEMQVRSSSDGMPFRHYRGCRPSVKEIKAGIFSGIKQKIVVGIRHCDRHPFDFNFRIFGAILNRCVNLSSPNAYRLYRWVLFPDLDLASQHSVRC